MSKYALTIVIILLACQSAGREIKRSDLTRNWKMSMEEKSDQGRVYRPDTYDFPRARGREGFELFPDSTFVEYLIGPTDGYIKLRGNWKIVSGNELEFSYENKELPPKKYSIISLDKDKLVLKSRDR